MLQKQTINIPLTGGLDTKTDPFLVEAGSALELENARLQKTGRLSKRYGDDLISSTTDQGQLDDTMVRNIVADDKFMAVTTSEGVYGYSEAGAKWNRLSRFSISANIKTEFVHKNYFEQKAVDSDVSADGQYMVYIATQELPNYTRRAILVVEDLITGVKKSTIITQATNLGLQRVACIKTAGTLYIHAFYYFSGGIYRTIYNQDLGIVSAQTLITACTDLTQFDVCKDGIEVYMVKIVGLTMTLFRYAFFGSQIGTNSVATPETIKNTGTYAGGMSICTTANNLHVAWISTNFWNIQGFTKGLVAAVAINGDNGDYRKIGIGPSAAGLNIVVDAGEGATFPFIDYNTATFTTTYVLNSASIMSRMSLASQPFEVDGKALVLLKCSEAGNKNYYLTNLTNEYFLAKVSPELAIDNLSNNSIAGEYVAMVSKVSIIGDTVYSAIPRRVRIDTSDNALDFFSTSGISKTQWDFSLDYKDGCRSKIGESIYLTSGMTLEIDHRAPHENGFMINPTITATQTTGTPDPDVASKTFSYIAIYEYLDSSGQKTRSAPSLPATISTNASAASIHLAVKTLLASLKQVPGSSNTSIGPAIVIYRTKASGTTYYRLLEFVSTQYQGGDETFEDAQSDAALGNNEILYTNGNVLANDSTPASVFSTAGGNRLFLGGLEEKDEIAYSKEQLFGESVAFSDFFRIRVPVDSSPVKSPISALGYMDGKLVIFREKSIFFVAGNGPNELGLNNDFSEPQIISSDAGCIEPRSVLIVPAGLMFKSRKGIYIINRGLNLDYIGAPVESFNDSKVIASVMCDKENEARFYTDSGTCLVYNFFFNAWSTSLGQTTTDADVWKNSPVTVKSDLVYQETTGEFLDGDAPYSLKVKTPWIKVSGVQDFARIWRAFILGKFKSFHTLRVVVRYDYNDDYTEGFVINPDSADTQYQYAVHLRKQKCEAVQFEIYDESQAGDCESMELTGLTLEVGLRTGAMKLGATRKY